MSLSASASGNAPAQGLENMLGKIDELANTESNATKRVALFCLTQLTQFLWAERYGASWTHERYIKLREKDHPIMSDEEYTQAANLLRPYGLHIAKMIWIDGSRREVAPIAYIIYRDGLDEITKREYYRDFADYFDPKVEKVY